MSESKADPSMEEILASIRRIISEDNPEGGGKAAADDDVIELTEVVEQPRAAKPDSQVGATLAQAMAAAGRAADAGQGQAAPAPLAAVAEEERGMDDKPDDKPGDAPDDAGASPAPMAAPSGQTRREEGEGLVSTLAAETSARAFGALAAAMDAAHAPAGPSLGHANRTLEDIVRDLLKPMLREWLDANLPGVVDRLVRKEIREMVRRSEER